MKPRGRQPPEDVRRRVIRYGLWRWVAAAPAVIGSLLLLMLTAGALGRGSGLLLVTWAACAAVVTTRVGERMSVRAAYRFRRPNPAQAAALQPAWATALRVTGTKAEQCLKPVDEQDRGGVVPSRIILKQVPQARPARQRRSGRYDPCSP
jgi:hypothetical protein